MSILEKREFGTTKDGTMAYLYTIENQNGMKMTVTDFGAALVNLFVPDRDGNLRDVVLGYDDARTYEERGAFFGAAVGRSANRIKGAAFEINAELSLMHYHSGKMFVELLEYIKVKEKKFKNTIEVAFHICK